MSRRLVLFSLAILGAANLAAAQDTSLYAPSPPTTFSPSEIRSPETAPQDISQQLAAHASVAKSTLLQALTGETEAIKTLLSDYLGSALMVLVLLVVGYLAAAFFGQLVSSVMAQRVDVMLGRFLGRLITYTVMAMVVLGILGSFGIDVTSFAAILAAAGFAIGMALQGSLSNFAAGVMLLVFRPFKIGDYVKLGDAQGTVYELDLFTTRLDTPDNRRVIVPNSEVFGKVIVNFTHNDTRRVEVNVGVDYTADLRETRRTLEQAIAMIPGAVSNPEPQVMLCELADSSVNWQLRVWCRPEQYWTVKESTLEAAKEALDRARISIPFPQLDVHVVGGAASVKQAA